MTRHLGRLGVIVPAGPDRAELARCLDLLRPAAAAGARVVVVDGSEDARDAEFVRAAFPFVRVRAWRSLASRGPVGLGAWLHLGVEAVGRREFLAVVNANARMDVPDLAELVGALDSDPGAAIAQPRVVPEGRDLACSVVRRADWELVGGTDAALVLEHVGEDLALRLARRGRRVLDVRSIVVAVDEPTQPLEDQATVRLRRRDRARFLARHGSGVAALLARGRLALSPGSRTRV